MNRLQVAIGVVVREGRVLICRRAESGAFAGLWEFPGGKCEAGESPADAVRRELWEELEIRVTPVRTLEVIAHQYPAVHVTLHPFLCRVEAGQPRAISAVEFRWVPPGELATYSFPEASIPLLSQLAVPGGIDLPDGGA